MTDSGRLDNKNTLKKTKFDLRIVQSYLCRVQEQRPLLSIPVGELDTHLANFIHTHRKQDGSEYEPGTLRGILGSLDRHFEKCGYPHAIYRSRETKFLKTVNAMKEKQCYLKTIGKGNHPNHAEPLTEREIELLYSSGAIGLHNPTALLHMLFFNIGLHFSLRTMEQHSLKWGDIVLKADPQGRKYLEHTKKLSPGRNSGRLHPAHTMTMQIYESPEQPERDVVKAYEKYTAERPEKMKCKDAPFYLTPQPDCRPGYARWFKNLPMGETRIRSIMKNLKMAAGLSPQRRVTNHCALKSPNMKGSVKTVPPTPLMKSPRGSRPMNGCRSNGRAVKMEDVASYCANDVSDAAAPSRGPRNGNVSVKERGDVLSSPPVRSPKNKIIKEEWEPREASELRVIAEEKSFFPGQGSVMFQDVAASFSPEEWGVLEDWQKELYKNVMREIHSALQAMGYKIVNADVLLKVKDDECKKNCPADDCPDSTRGGGQSVSPDILLRIKHDELPDWRDLEVPEKEEEEMDTSSSSLPVFDPDLSLWIFREEPDVGSPDDAKDQTPVDLGEGASLPQHVPSSYKEPLPEISTLYNPGYTEGPRPGKRKRRPPQRRSNEQRTDSDCDNDEPTHRLPCRNLAAVERADWMLEDKLYQCDLCERTYSDRSGETFLACPHCGGTLNSHPLFHRQIVADAGAGFPQTLRFSDINVDAGFSHPMQGPVG
ncbi:uncharacterized protein LOC134908811 [Pseudophryne corroboree]|uniref:uncharacterized protein LOC134908811 n=1 Tax=Pseudophryne corroboree TaxID=495146 RepID=UPI003081F51E